MSYEAALSLPNNLIEILSLSFLQALLVFFVVPRLTTKTLICKQKQFAKNDNYCLEVLPQKTKNAQETKIVNDWIADQHRMLEIGILSPSWVMRLQSAGVFSADATNGYSAKYHCEFRNITSKGELLFWAAGSFVFGLAVFSGLDLGPAILAMLFCVVLTLVAFIDKAAMLAPIELSLVLSLIACCYCLLTGGLHLLFVNAGIAVLGFLLLLLVNFAFSKIGKIDAIGQGDIFLLPSCFMLIGGACARFLIALSVLTLMGCMLKKIRGNNMSLDTRFPLVPYICLAFSLSFGTTALGI